MKISRKSFVNKYKQLKKCNTQKALQKWKKILLHFGIDSSIKTLNFGMNNNSTTNQAVVPQVIQAQQPLYRAIELDGDVFVINDNNKIILAEVKRLDNGNYKATHFLKIKTNEDKSVEFKSEEVDTIQDALQFLEFNGLVHEPLSYTVRDNNQNTTYTTTTRFVDASLVLNFDFLDKCNIVLRNDLRNCLTRLLNLTGLLRQKYFTDSVESFKTTNRDFYENFHKKPIDSQTNTSRRYHLTFHKPPSHNDVGAFHFKIDDLGLTGKLMFDIIDRKFSFSKSRDFPQIQQLDNLLICIAEKLDGLLVHDKIEGVYPTLHNELDFRGKITMLPSHPIFQSRLENRVNARINRNANNNTNKLNLSKYDLTNIKSKKNLKDKILELTQNNHMTMSEIEEMFFVLGMANFSNSFVNEVYFKNTTFQQNSA